MATNGKVLRIGIVQGGKILEERLLKSRHPVSIGSAPRNTIILGNAGLPPSFTVFPMNGESYLIAFSEKMEGNVRTDQGTESLSALARKGQAPKEGELYTLAISDEQRGKITIGEITLLWQFVTGPDAPKTILTGMPPGGSLRSLDRLFSGLLIASLILHFSAYVALASTPKREEATLEEIPDRFAKLLIPDRKVEPPKSEKRAEAVGDAQGSKKDEGKKSDDKDDGPPSAEKQAARAAAVAKAVQSKGILKVLGALGPGTGSGAVANVFGEGGGFGDVAAALSGAGGVAIATDPGAGGGRKGGGSGGTASIGVLATGGGGGGRVNAGAKSEVRVSGTVATEAVDVDSPDIDQQKLSGFIRARIGSIKSCYEQSLKRNPNLRGKIRIRFTILETGGLAEISAIENSVGSPEVASCIVMTMRSWRTPFKPSSPVTAEFPFVFQPTS